jgi:hypothetical protein
MIEFLLLPAPEYGALLFRCPQTGDTRDGGATIPCQYGDQVVTDYQISTDSAMTQTSRQLDG